MTQECLLSNATTWEQAKGGCPQSRYMAQNALTNEVHPNTDALLLIKITQGRMLVPSYLPTFLNL